MRNLFHNKFLIPTTRLSGWDYSQSGYYFVTICTYKKQEYFGEIANGKMNVSEMGRIAIKKWQEIPNHFPSIKLDEFIVMPNHIHGIIIVRNNTNTNCRDGACPVSTEHINTLGDVVGSFKSAVTKHIHKQNINFSWQSRYYDHVIRNEESYYKIVQYIRDNPKNWEEDRNSTEDQFITNLSSERAG